MVTALDARKHGFFAYTKVLSLFLQTGDNCYKKWFNSW